MFLLVVGNVTTSKILNEVISFSLNSVTACEVCVLQVQVHLILIDRRFNCYIYVIFVLLTGYEIEKYTG